MKIISLKAENVKRLKAVEIVPEGNTVKHAKVEPSKIVFRFRTKLDGMQHIVLPKASSDKWQKLLYRNLTERFLVGKDEDEKVWSWRERRTSRYVHNKDVNAWLHKFSPNLTSHIFRGLNATKIVLEHLSKFKLQAPAQKGKTDSQFKKEFAAYAKKVTEAYLKAATAAGKELGHFATRGVTSNTAISSFISPDVTKQFFEDKQVPLPTNIATLLKQSKKMN